MGMVYDSLCYDMVFADPKKAMVFCAERNAAEDQKVGQVRSEFTVRVYRVDECHLLDDCVKLCHMLADGTMVKTENETV